MRSYTGKPDDRHPFTWGSKSLCAKCQKEVDQVAGRLDNGTPEYVIRCHGEEFRIPTAEHDKFRVDGPVPGTWEFFKTV